MIDRSSLERSDLITTSKCLNVVLCAGMESASLTPSLHTYVIK